KKALRTQAARDCRYGESLPSDPVEDLADDAGLVEDDLVVWHVGTLRFADVAISIRRVHQRAYRSPLGRMPPSTTRSLDDLGPFIFRDDALDLYQELVFGGRLARVVEKDDVHAHPAEFVQEERLMRVFARYAVGAVHIHPLHATHRGKLAQAFQRRTDKRARATT